MMPLYYGQDVDYEEPDAFCVICGREVGDCECIECPECGVTGDPGCAANHGMVTFPRLWWSGDYREYAMQQLSDDELTINQLAELGWDFDSLL